MLSFLSRRLVASIIVLLIASYIVYVLTCVSGDPLSDLRTSTARNKEQLIQTRIRILNLDVVPPLRYFIWFAGLLRGFIGKFDLGQNVHGQAVTTQLASAMGSTLQLVLTATVLAIVIGITIGITTALRQYTAYDYSVTFISFLFFSLPIFWLAVMLKQYLAINFNDFLQDPTIPPLTIAIISVVAGIIWLGILGGTFRRRAITFVIAGAVTAIVLTFFSATKWFEQPSLGPIVILILGVGTAFLVTLLTTGLNNRKALYSSLTMVVLLMIAYFPLSTDFPLGYQLFDYPLNVGTMIIYLLVAIALGIVSGFLWGGHDRVVSARAGAITGFVVMLIIFLDRFMKSWSIYAQNVGGRPLATIGSQTPDLDASFWVHGIDSFSHLLLPTFALLLASLAGYSRYSRASLLDVMNQDYIRTARAKGLSERTVVMRHAFRNALIPITTIIALDFGALIGGAVVTERVFGWVGMGQMFQQALQPIPDVNPVMGVFLVTGTAAVLFNLVADVIYSALDPRIRVAA